MKKGDENDLIRRGDLMKTARWAWNEWNKAMVGVENRRQENLVYKKQQLFSAVEKVAAVVPVADRWVPVTERLPDEEFNEWAKMFPDGNVEPFEVIVYIKGGKVSTTLYYDNGDFFDQDCYSYNVTHWMPLPELPKEENP